MNTSTLWSYCKYQYAVRVAEFWSQCRAAAVELLQGKTFKLPYPPIKSMSIAVPTLSPIRPHSFTPALPKLLCRYINCRATEKKKMCELRTYRRTVTLGYCRNATTVRYRRKTVVSDMLQKRYCELLPKIYCELLRMYCGAIT